MKILDIYLFKHTSFMILIVLMGIAGLLFVTGVADEAARRVNETYTLGAATLYVLMTIPSAIQEYITVIVMLGTLISVATLNKHQELTTVQLTAGSSFGLVSRLMLPALILLPAIFVFGQWYTPKITQWAESERALLLGKNEPTLTGEWYKINNEVINIERIVSSTEMIGVTQFKFSDENEFIGASFSPRLNYTDGQWVASDSRDVYISPNSVIKTFDSEKIITNGLLEPEILNTLVAKYDELTLSRLYQQLQFKKSAGTLTPQLELTFWHRVLFPIEYVAMLLISIAMGMASFRQRTVGDAAFKTLIIGVAFSLILKTVSSGFALLALPILTSVAVTNGLFFAAALFYLTKKL